MAATKYQVLYRYINEATNTAITNSMENPYERVLEFYTDPDHKIFSTDPAVQAEAVDEQQEMIAFGNSSENPKTNMLFAYDGAKKIKHKKWVEEATGYIVKDWKQLKRSSIGNQGDFTKDFTTLNAATPEDGGIVVCSARALSKYFQAGNIATSGRYTSAQLNQMIDDYSVFQLIDSNWRAHAASPSSYTRYSGKWSQGTSSSVYTGPIYVDTTNSDFSTISGYNPGGDNWGTTTGVANQAKASGTIRLIISDIETTNIPGHYEDVTDAPYLIMDTYKRIQLSPWFVHCTSGSLESSLAKARALVDMIGMENVKLIKIVPFDQFIKIN